MPTRNIRLTDHYDRFIDERVSAGRFRDASEVLRAGLRLLEQQELEDKQKLDLLHALAAEGFDQLDQGQGVELHGKEQLTSHIAQLGRESTSKRRAKGA